jgi:hypothetical protein
MRLCRAYLLEEGSQEEPIVTRGGNYGYGVYGLRSYGVSNYGDPPKIPLIYGSYGVFVITVIRRSKLRSDHKRASPSRRPHLEFASLHDFSSMHPEEHHHDANGS